MQYIAYNGAMQTTASFVGVTTGTAVKTMLQIATPSTCTLRVRSWGIFFDGSAAAAPIKCELIDTATVAATVTAHVAAGVQPFDAEAGATASLMTLGTGATGYTASAEGTITATRIGDLAYVPPTGGYVYEFALGNEFQVTASRFLRVRVTAGAARDCVTWIRWCE